MKRITACIILAVLLLASLPLTAIGEASSAPEFSDVPAGCWYEQAVLWASENGITSGVGEGKFGPNLEVTRGQVVTMLWRIESSPEPSGRAAFSDVPDGKWYSNAVDWASANHIVAGYPGNIFAPNRVITRQELVTILYRYAQYKDNSVAAPDTDISYYSDYAEISDFAVEAMRWAVGNGIVNGTSATTLCPKGTATRAQLVQILYRWLSAPEETPVDSTEPTESTGDDWELPFIPNP